LLKGDIITLPPHGEQSWLDSAGNPHSDQLHLVERNRRLNEKTLRYKVTVDDPKAYTRPWSTSHIYRVNPGTEIMEYWCTETKSRETYGRKIDSAQKGFPSVLAAPALRRSWLLVNGEI
jgi:hypothetical protein